MKKESKKGNELLDAVWSCLFVVFVTAGFLAFFYGEIKGDIWASFHGFALVIAMILFRGLSK